MCSAPLFQLVTRHSGSGVKMAWSLTPSIRRRNRSSWARSDSCARTSSDVRSSTRRPCSSRPARSSSSACLRPVRSRVTLPKPVSAPDPSRTAVMTPPAHGAEPSFRTRHPSSSTRPSAATSSSRAGFPYHLSSAVREAREVPADDLLGPVAVALDPLGPPVPTDDGAGRVEQEDGVALDRLDQESELAFVPLPRGVLGVHAVALTFRPGSAGRNGTEVG